MDDIFFWPPAAFILICSTQEEGPDIYSSPLLLFDQVNGNAGAGQIAPVLEGQLHQNQETLDFLLDEGMFVMQVVSLPLPFPLPLPPLLSSFPTLFSTEPEFVNV